MRRAARGRRPVPAAPRWGKLGRLALDAAGPAAAAAGAGVFTSLNWIRVRSVAPFAPSSLSPAAASLWLGAGLGLALWLSLAGLLRLAGEDPWLSALRRGGRCAAPAGLLGLAVLGDVCFLGEIQGFLALAAALAVAASAGRRLATLAELRGRPAGRLAACLMRLPRSRVAALVGAAALAFGLAQALELFDERRSLVGDEPAYVTVTHSLATDGDIVMNDDYLDREYERWVTGNYPAFAHPGRDNRLYPHHGLGLSVYLVPFYLAVRPLSDGALVAGLRSAMALLFALLTANLYLLAEEFWGNRRAALGLAGLLAASLPLASYATEIYPETAAALALVWGVRQARRIGAAPGRRALAAGTAAAVLPWLGMKYAPAALMLAGLALWYGLRAPGRVRMLVGLALPAAAGGGAMAAFLWRVYGVLSPQAIVRGVAHPLPGGGALEEIARIASDPLFALRTLADFTAGSLFDQRVGLLVWAPVFVFLISDGLRALRHRPAVAALMAPGLTHFAFYAYSNNWGGYCPPNRPIIAALPLLALPLAETLRDPGRPVRRLLLALAVGLSLIWSWTFLTHDRWFHHTMNPHLRGGEAISLAQLSMPYGPHWPGWFPLVMGPEKAVRVNAVWLAGTAVLVIADLAWGRRRRPVPPWLQGRRLDGLLERRSGTIAALVLGGLILAWRAWALPGDQIRIELPGPPAYAALIQGNGAYGPELGGLWVAGDRRAEGYLELPVRPATMAGSAHSLIENELALSLGGPPVRVELPAGERRALALPAGPIFERGGRHYLKMRAQTATGLVPQAAGDDDDRNLGAFLKLKPEP